MSLDSQPREIIARWPGRCSKCGGKFLAGSIIVLDRKEGRLHLDCAKSLWGSDYRPYRPSETQSSRPGEAGCMLTGFLGWLALGCLAAAMGGLLALLMCR